MGGGFLFLIAGGLIGYQFGKDRTDPAHRGCGPSWHERWHENRRRAWDAKIANVGQSLSEKNAGTASAEGPAPATSTRSWFGGVNANEWQAFQAWRAQQQRSTAAAGPQPFVDTKDVLRETAIDGADKALDALLVQVSSLKEKLGHYKSSPGTPATEAGEFKLV